MTRMVLADAAHPQPGGGYDPVTVVVVLLVLAVAVLVLLLAAVSRRR
ncbi:hypothetical protein [Actinacidiphila acididurans]|uniref:Uncharacterized protein n=1 Tax=Actinacidiphila acididurans TaxID=2784346 RepID=A0ABS2TV19_9ACTN|nr:hypothetical protein [Actinacidiphila acididurans]MBM9506135.1 hypothetical protein [Actinacidiphila acididurans]